MNKQNNTAIITNSTSPAPSALSAHKRAIALEPAFLSLAEEFGMIPERMAERILSAFAAQPPTHVIVKARKSAVQSSR